MGLKFSVDDISGIDESLKSFYVEKEGKYVLDVDGQPSDDLEGIRSNRDRALSQLKSMKKEKEELEKAMRDIQDKKAQETGDYKSLLDSTKKDLETWQQKYKSLEDQVDNREISQTVKSLSSKLSGNQWSDLIEPHISKRLKIVEIDGQKKIGVLDINGNLSSSTISDLENEFRNNSLYQHIIVGNKSSGGGSPGSRLGSAASETQILDPRQRIAKAYKSKG